MFIQVIHSHSAMYQKQQKKKELKINVFFQKKTT